MQKRQIGKIFGIYNVNPRTQIRYYNDYQIHETKISINDGEIIIKLASFINFNDDEYMKFEFDDDSNYPTITKIRYSSITNIITEKDEIKIYIGKSDKIEKETTITKVNKLNSCEHCGSLTDKSYCKECLQKNVEFNKRTGMKFGYNLPSFEY